jgi:hypothetical protein
LANGGYSIYLGAVQTTQTLTQQKTVNANGTYDVHYFGAPGTFAVARAANAIETAMGISAMQLWAEKAEVANLHQQANTEDGDSDAPGKP